VVHPYNISSSMDHRSSDDNGAQNHQLTPQKQDSSENTPKLHAPKRQPKEAVPLRLDRLCLPITSNRNRRIKAIAILTLPTRINNNNQEFQ
jgi:hypothetical protein